MIVTVSGIFERCLAPGRARNKMADKNAEDSQSSKQVAATGQKHAKARKEKEKKREQVIEKLGDLRPITDDFLRKSRKRM
jgi:hypothetical protein